MVLALVTLALATAQDVQLGTVDVGGRQVMVTVPAERGPFTVSTPNIAADGWKFQLLPDGSAGVRYRSDGGWGEVADSYLAAAVSAAAATEYRIKVFLLTNTMLLELGRDGVWRSRTGSMTAVEQGEVFAALARFKALAETATNGAVRLTFDVTVDDDLLFRVANANAKSVGPEVLRMTATDNPANDSTLGPSFIHSEIGPRVNNDAFQSEDGKYNGPYSSVFVVHAMRTWDVSSYLLDRTPVTSVSWATFTDREPGTALSIQLYYAWAQHLTLSARAHGRTNVVERALPTGKDLPQTPQVYNVAYPESLLRFGNHFANPAFSDGQVPGDAVTSQPALPKTTGTLLAQPIYSPPPAQGLLDLSPVGRGDFDAEMTDDPIVSRAVVVQESNYLRRGYVTLAKSDASAPLFVVAPDTGVQLRVSCDLPDSFVVRFITSDGGSLDALIFGEVLVPLEADETETRTIDVSREPGPFWSEFKIALGTALAGKSVVEVQLAPPQFAQFYDRKSDGVKTLKIGPVSFGPMTSPDTAMPKPESEDLTWLKELQGTVPDADLQRMRNLLVHADPSLRLNALGAMNRIKRPELIPDLARSPGSGDYGTAYLAINALRHQDETAAWSHIAVTAINGPFGHNYQFVSEALGDKVEDTTLQVLGVSLLQRSWHARLNAVRTVNKIDSEVAAIIASTTLTAPEPDPAVRFELARKTRPQSDLFARRILWSAVNDDSEWVRAMSYVSLLDSPFEQIREQALRGVRAESVAVRLAVLGAMTKSPKAHYRTALRAAVVDTEAVVRAAALRAFAVQPGEVVIGEVQNTVTDASPLVKAALQELARAKGLQIPPKP
ncbi:MAG: hypothetical protein WD716_06950 [Fimbriimonadaceae bacterium]